MSVRLSVRVQQICSHGTDFHEILCLKIFRKRISKYHYILRRLTGTLYEDLRMRNVSDRTLYKIKTHILCSVVLLQK